MSFWTNRSKKMSFWAKRRISICHSRAPSPSVIPAQAGIHLRNTQYKRHTTRLAVAGLWWVSPVEVSNQTATLFTPPACRGIVPMSFIGTKPGLSCHKPNVVYGCRGLLQAFLLSRRGKNCTPFFFCFYSYHRIITSIQAAKKEVLYEPRWMGWIVSMGV